MGNQLLLSFNIGLGKQDVTLWHLQGTAWTPYTGDPQMQTYDANGVFSFYDTSLQFGAFAVTGVPEPSTFALLSIGAISLLAYAWRRREQAA
jgi:hypothetical protein